MTDRFFFFLVFEMMMKWLVVAVGLVWSVALAGDVRVSQNRVSPHGYAFVDGAGRTRIFHGVNAVYKVDPWLPSIDGWDTNSTLSRDDAKNLSDWGFNVVRLGVMWPGFAPKINVTSDEYLQKVRQMVDMLGEYGIYTILDMHQDLGGRALCGEGFPDWAVNTSRAERKFPRPVVNKDYSLDKDGYPKLEQCLEVPFFTYYFTDAVGAAFQYVYDKLRDELAFFWGEVARHVANCSTVLGYELINEPWAGDTHADAQRWFPGYANRENLFPLYQRIHDSIRKYDDNSIIFFEKSLVNILGPIGFFSVPGGRTYRDRTALSWHNYCGSVDDDGNPKSTVICEFEQAVQLQQSYADIDAMECGSFLTEFGAVSGNSTSAIDTIHWLLDKADSAQQSWAYWQFKSYHDITTASNDVESFYWPNGSLQQDKVDALSRAYPQAVAGFITRQEFDRCNHRFKLWYEMLATPDGSGTVIFIGPFLKWAEKYNTTINVTWSNVPHDAVTTSFSSDHMFLFVNHSTKGGWKERDEIHLEVFLASASMKSISFVVLALLLLFGLLQ